MLEAQSAGFSSSMQDNSGLEFGNTELPVPTSLNLIFLPPSWARHLVSTCEFLFFRNAFSKLRQGSTNMPLHPHSVSSVRVLLHWIPSVAPASIKIFGMPGMHNAQLKTKRSWPYWAYSSWTYLARARLSFFPAAAIAHKQSHHFAFHALDENYWHL